MWVWGRVVVVVVVRREMEGAGLFLLALSAQKKNNNGPDWSDGHSKRVGLSNDRSAV